MPTPKPEGSLSSKKRKEKNILGEVHQMQLKVLSEQLHVMKEKHAKEMEILNMKAELLKAKLALCKQQFI